MDESNPTTPPFGPQFGPTIHDSGQVPPNIHGMNPITPQAERGVVQTRSRESIPFDGPPHKFHMLPPLGDKLNECFTEYSIHLGLPGPSGKPKSDRNSSNTGSNDSPGSHRSDAQSAQHDNVSHVSAAIVLQCFGLTTRTLNRGIHCATTLPHNTPNQST